MGRPLVLGVVAALALSSSALAVVINPGEIVAISGTTAALRPEFGGTVLVDQTVPFTIGTTTGTVQSRVKKSTTPGLLVFSYWVSCDAGTDTLSELRLLSAWTGLMDVDYRTDSMGSIAPDHAQRFAGTWSGDLNFILAATPIAAGQQSFDLTFLTDAATYTTGSADVWSNASASMSNAFSVYVPAVPEPTLLAPLSLAAAALLRRRSR